MLRRKLSVVLACLFILLPLASALVAGRPVDPPKPIEQTDPPKPVTGKVVGEVYTDAEACARIVIAAIGETAQGSNP